VLDAATFKTKILWLWKWSNAQPEARFLGKPSLLMPPTTSAVVLVEEFATADRANIPVRYMALLRRIGAR
jgi:hypothetical protein